MILRVLVALLLLAAPARAAELKLATWNIACGARLNPRPAGDPDIPRDVIPREAGDLARLRAYATRLAADVVALQEVEGPGAAALVLDPAEWQFFFPEENDIQRAGLAVRRAIPARQNPDLAALDIQPEAHFSLRRGVDVTVGEGASALRIQPEAPSPTVTSTPRRREKWASALRVLSVHLRAGCREPDDRGRECDGLTRQASILAGWIEARQAAGEAFAIAGDFNRRFDRDPAILPTLERAAPLTRATAGRSNPCWGGRPFIDHLLLGGPARGWLMPNSLRVMVYAEQGAEWRRRLSDHCPVSVVLDIP
jgi:endonuclease/exonuclease/phosphatase family metal-dependent hydrolase